MPVTGITTVSWLMRVQVRWDAVTVYRSPEIDYSLKGLKTKELIVLEGSELHGNGSAINISSNHSSARIRR